ncbi:MAG: Fe-S cluster assembly sulfur transfer protein SufU [Acidobacteriota bacterium]
MSDLRQLYQEIILDHYRSPRNHGSLDGADREAKGHNPLCGDSVKISIDLDGDRIHDIAFEGAGCAISTASASLLTEAIKGKTILEAEALGQNFRDLLTGRTEPGDHELGKLEAFVGVRELPVRVKCATLAWHTLKAALEDGTQTVTTES